MKSRKKFNPNKISSIIVIIAIIIFIIDYDKFFPINDLPSEKKGIIITIYSFVFEKLGKNSHKIILISIMIILFVIGVAQRIARSNKKYEIEIGTIIYWKNKDIIVESIESEIDGYSGIGYYNIGLLKEVKQRVEFKNIQIDYWKKLKRGEIEIIKNNNNR